MYRDEPDPGRRSSAWNILTPFSEPSKKNFSVPKPVLISSMKEHQGFFSLMTKDGALLPKFIAVTNMPWEISRLMTKRNERVLSARLSDANISLQKIRNARYMNECRR